MDFIETLKSMENGCKGMVSSIVSNIMKKSIKTLTKTPETLERVNSLWKESKEYDFIHDLYINKNLLGQHIKSVSQSLMTSDADREYWNKVLYQLKLID